MARGLRTYPASDWGQTWVEGRKCPEPHFRQAANLMRYRQATGNKPCTAGYIVATYLRNKKAPLLWSEAKLLSYMG